MTGLADQTVVVTGASGGIGKAIASCLAEHGARICLCGRDRKKLEQTAGAMPGGKSHCYAADLGNKRELETLANQLTGENPRIDVLIHCAATISLGPVKTASVEDLENQLQVNVVAPFRLTQLLLPRLIEAQGQVLFINSSAGLGGRPNVGQYAASKHALKGLADSLRGECNPLGVRVCSLFLGNTASPMQASIRKQQGQPYNPEDLIQPQDVAAMALTVLTIPRTAEVTDVMIRPMKKS